MNISVEKLLMKIEEELKQAKNSSKQENLREKVYSIKILCELILDEKQNRQEVPVARFRCLISLSWHSRHSAASIIKSAKKIEMEDEANGDSLFDF